MGIEFLSSSIFATETVEALPHLLNIGKCAEIWDKAKLLTQVETKYLVLT